MGAGQSSTTAADVDGRSIRIFYASVGGSSKKFALGLQAALHNGNTRASAIVHDLLEEDVELTLLKPQQTIDILIIPSYNVETPIDGVLGQIRDAANDFRVGHGLLAKQHFAVLGIGHSAYEKQEYQSAAYELDALLAKLGGNRMMQVGNVDTANDPEGDFSEWTGQLIQLLEEGVRSGLLPTIQDDSASDEASVETPSDEETSEEENTSKLTPAQEKARRLRKKARRKAGLSGKRDPDIEDLGAVMPEDYTSRTQIDETAEDVAKMNLDGQKIRPKVEAKEMISSLTRKALTKQGYGLIGSHSGVKTCRWTKAALRGRGFCYKHTFYGIMSHRCMETTPSLACANKCVFCWRSHTNPVGTSWRWKVDQPEDIVNGALAEHDRMIKQLRGMPEVRPERFEEARTPKHAALSLVGEPILYPHIQKYIQLLHEKHISTFLVTNAQFPEPMRSLGYVTQLYMSIDAGDKVSLKEVDRPLHRDYWERLLECVDIVRDVKSRTVFRLTLVKEFNAEEVEGYKTLIKRGRPDFIEVKGVTFCGYGGSSGLTIKNSPFHEEVVKFVQALVDALDDDPETKGEYALASEHVHSCCVLAASTKFLIDDVWHTWIDYDRFFELLESGKEFNAFDYTAPTPSWAHFGAPELGFSPEDTRWHRKQSKAVEI